MDWEYLSKKWYKNAKAFNPEDPTLHLKMIVSKQWSRSIPTKPPVFLPAKKALPQLRTQSPDIVAIEADSL